MFIRIKNTFHLLIIYLQDQYLHEEGLSEHFGIAEFAAAVHESACSEDEEDQSIRMDGQPSCTKQLPSVASMVHLVTIFSELLKDKKAKIHTKVNPKIFCLSYEYIKVQGSSHPLHMQDLSCSCTLILASYTCTLFL